MTKEPDKAPDLELLPTPTIAYVDELEILEVSRPFEVKALKKVGVLRDLLDDPKLTADTDQARRVKREAELELEVLETCLTAILREHTLGKPHQILEPTP